MDASKGALDHATIMGLTWRQFGVYMDAFTWLAREQSEKGRQENARDDLEAMSKIPEVKERKQKMVLEAKERVRKAKKRSGKGKSVKRDLLKLEGAAE